MHDVTLRQNSVPPMYTAPLQSISVLSDAFLFLQCTSHFSDVPLHAFNTFADFAVHSLTLRCIRPAYHFGCMLNDSCLHTVISNIFLNLHL